MVGTVTLIVKVCATSRLFWTAKKLTTDGSLSNVRFQVVTSNALLAGPPLTPEQDVMTPDVVQFRRAGVPQPLIVIESPAGIGSAWVGLPTKRASARPDSAIEVRKRRIRTMPSSDAPLLPGSAPRCRVRSFCNPDATGGGGPVCRHQVQVLGIQRL